MGSDRAAALGAQKAHPAARRAQFHGLNQLSQLIREFDTYEALFHLRHRLNPSEVASVTMAGRNARLRDGALGSVVKLVLQGCQADG